MNWLIIILLALILIVGVFIIFDLGVWFGNKLWRKEE